MLGRVVALTSVAALAACSVAPGVLGAATDPTPLGLADNVVVVAHQDDDLLFMQPDLSDLVTAHAPLVVVYVTAGDADHGLRYAESRVVAARAAYSMVAGASDWECGWIAVAGHAAEHCRLASANVSLVFLGYPDGGVGGDFAHSLLRLWQGELAAVTTVGREPASYDRDGLIATVAEIIHTAQPTTIRTLEIAATHGEDNSDHMIVGALAVLAAAQAGSPATLLAYRGYNSNFDPANTPDEIYAHVSLGMRAYEACQLGCGVCGQTACPTLSDPRYDGFVHRHYAIATREPPLSGVLQLGASCAVVAADGSVALGSCVAATKFDFEIGGALRAGGRCLGVGADGTLAAGACAPSPSQYFTLDDEGHIWAGVAAPPAPHMDTLHTMCVVPDGAITDHRVSVAPCGADRDVRWQLARAAIATPRDQLGLTSTGRAIRLGDLTGDGYADLCAVEAGGLMCAAGDGHGAFAPAVRIDSEIIPLAIEPSSLVIGDVDGDGKPDACGRDARGILCATAASRFAAQRWTTAFATTTNPAATDRSLAIVDRQICGLGLHGVQCAGKNVNAPPILSAWPAVDAALWAADLDADGRPDWCIATPKGPACGLDAQRRFTQVGVPWGFSQRGVVEGSAGDRVLVDYARVALADVSGDGKADLCAVVGSTVQCALSAGRGFGPRTVVFAPSVESPVVGLWLGDVNGDGKADPCVDDGNVIQCSMSP